MQLQIDRLGERIGLISRNLSVIRVSLKYGDGSPAYGLIITGLLNENKEADSVKTDGGGNATGYIDKLGELRISLDSYADVGWSTNINVEEYAQIYEVSGTVSIYESRMYTTTRDIRFSSNIKNIDFALSGGGGGGGGGGNDMNSSCGGCGGGGAYIQTVENKAIVPTDLYSFTCGSGGSGGTPGTLEAATAGTRGGTSSFMGVSSSGGNGGAAFHHTDTSASVGGGSGASITYGIYSTAATGGMLYKDQFSIGGGGGGGGSGARSVAIASDMVTSFANDRPHSSGSFRGGVGGALTTGTTVQSGVTLYGGAANGSSGSSGGGGGGGGARMRMYQNDSSGIAGYGGKGGDGCLCMIFHRTESN